MSILSKVPITAPRMELHDYRAELEAQTPEEIKGARDDLYGHEVPQPEETEDFLSAKLQELKQEIAKKRSNTAYDQAVIRCPNYAMDRDFELMFLRADYFDAKKAAHRMVEYWKAKLKAFGEDKTYKRITLDDLSDDDLANFKTGRYSMLPDRDKAGRAVFFCWSQELVYKERDNMVRLIFYLVNAAMESVEVQRKGAVLIAFEQGFNIGRYDRKLDKQLLNYSNHVWPTRFVSIHYCFTSKLNELVMPLALVMLGRKMRARLQLHPGSRIESRFEALADFGLEKDKLPKLMGGTLDFDPEQWLDARRSQGL